VPTPTIEAGPGPLGVLVPVLTYTDTTPVLAVSRMTGVLVIDMGLLKSIAGGGEEDEGREERLEEEVGLLVTAALAYLDFLGDREVSSTKLYAVGPATNGFCIF
jgi:hypothetical protein